MDQAGNATKKLVTTWNDARRAIWDSSQRILLAVTAMTAGAVKTFADFEDAMVEVGAITRTLGTKDFALLEQAAISMGEKTRYSATEAAGGLKQLSLSGMSAREAIEALEPTLQLASASGLSIAQSASISAKMMKAMGLSARDLTAVNDVLVSTFQRSNTDLNMLAEGMKHAAPLSHALGVSLEDTTAILAKLSDAGFQGEMGGTALRNIMSRLAGALPQVSKKLREAGIESLNSAGNMRPLLDVLADIEKAGLSAGDIMGIFGQRGGPQLLALMEVGIKSVREFSDETKKQMGVGAEMAAARTKTIKGQVDELMSFIETIFLDTGKSISGEVVKLINDIEAFLKVNRKEVLEEMHRAAMGLVSGLQSLLQWVKENSVAMLEMVQTFGGFIRWIFEFMAAHPQLMAALLALKVTGLLGLNDAALMTARALGVTIQQLIQFRIAAVTASTAGTASAAGIGTAFTGLAAAGGPIALAAVAIGGLGLLFYKMRIDAEAQIKQLDKSLEQMAKKNSDTFLINKQKKVDEIGNSKDSDQKKMSDVAKEADAANSNINRLKNQKNRTVNLEVRERLDRDIKDQEQARQIALQKQQQLAEDFMKPAFKAAKDKDPVKTAEIEKSFAKLTEQMLAGKISAEEFRQKLEFMKLDLEKTARGFDPAVEGLRSFNNTIASTAGVDSKEWKTYNKFLEELNSVKTRLGASFKGIVDQVNWLNSQFEQGLITQEEYNRQLIQIRQQAAKPLQEQNDAVIKDKIAKNKAEEEQAGLADFEGVKDLMSTGTENLTAESVKAIGESVDGATPEIVQQLVEDFTALQAQGEEAVAEGMDELIVSFLQSVEEAKDDAEKKADNNKAALDAYKPGGVYSDVKTYAGAAGGEIADNSLYQMFHQNQTAMQNGQISQEQYADRSKSISNVAGQSAGALGDADAMLAASNKATWKMTQDGGNKDVEKFIDKGMKDATDSFKKKVKELTDEFAKGGLTEEEFTNKLKGLKDELGKAGNVAKELADKEQELINKRKSENEEMLKAQMIANGNFAGAGVNPQLMFWQKVAAFRMQQLNNQIEAMVQNFLVANGWLPQFNQGLQQATDGLQHFGNATVQWAEGKDAGSAGNSIQGGLNMLYNSIQGALAIANNNIALVAQKLHLTRLPYSKLAEYQKELEYWVAQRDALLNQPPPTFIGQSSDPFFHDPGVVGGGGSSNTSNTANNNLTINMNGVDPASPQGISKIADALSRELKRRGNPFNPLS